MPSVSPYATALDLGRPKPNWVPRPEDADRVQSYFTYEDVFHNVKDAFAVVLRDAAGEEAYRRYVPAARTIIEATNRYLCKGMTYVSTVPTDVTLSDEDVAATMQLLTSTFKREEFTAKFLSMKRWMLIKGDSLLHVTADPLKPQGSRLRITELPPEFYFPIHHPIDTERVIGCYITSLVEDDEGEEIAQRIEYRRVLTEEDASTYGVPVGSIWYRVQYFEPDGWDDRAPLTEEDLAPVDAPAWAATPEGSAQDPLAGYALPATITAIPVYHFRNNRRGTAPFGTSELQGVETLVAGVHQAITDTDLAVALTGIGVYATDSGKPRDSQGNETEWVIAPASVVELEAGKSFKRVEGVGRDGVEAMHAHSDKLQTEARQATATPDIAVGRVDVSVASSGVALAIEMAPIISKNEEKEEEISSKLDQLLYDLLNGWFPAYEQHNAGGLVVNVVFGDPLPVNREAVVTEVTELVTAKVISAQFAMKVLKDKLGYEIDPQQMLREIAQEAQALLDADGAQLDAAAQGAGGEGDA